MPINLLGGQVPTTSQQNPLLQFLNNPGTLLGLNVLSDANHPAQALLKGLTYQREAELQRLRAQAIQQAVMEAQQRQAQEQAQQQAAQQAQLTAQNAAQAYLQRTGDIAGAQRLASMQTPTGPAISPVSPSSFTPDSLARYQQTGNYSDLVCPRNRHRKP